LVIANRSGGARGGDEGERESGMRALRRTRERERGGGGVEGEREREREEDAEGAVVMGVRYRVE